MNLCTAPFPSASAVLQHYRNCNIYYYYYSRFWNK